MSGSTCGASARPEKSDVIRGNVEVPKIVLAAFFGKGYYGPFFGVQYCNGNIRKACQK